MSEETAIRIALFGPIILGMAIATLVGIGSRSVKEGLNFLVFVPMAMGFIGVPCIMSIIFVTYAPKPLAGLTIGLVASFLIIRAFYSGTRR